MLSPFITLHVVCSLALIDGQRGCFRPRRSRLSRRWPGRSSWTWVLFDPRWPLHLRRTEQRARLLWLDTDETLVWPVSTRGWSATGLLPLGASGDVTGCTATTARTCMYVLLACWWSFGLRALAACQDEIFSDGCRPESSMPDTAYTDWPSLQEPAT